MMKYLAQKGLVWQREEVHDEREAGETGEPLFILTFNGSAKGLLCTRVIETVPEAGDTLDDYDLLRKFPLQNDRAGSWAGRILREEKGKVRP